MKAEIDRPAKRVYSVAEAAKVLVVGRATLYRAVNRNEVPNLKIGARVVIPAWWIDKFLEMPDDQRTGKSETHSDAHSRSSESARWARIFPVLKVPGGDIPGGLGAPRSRSQTPLTANSKLSTSLAYEPSPEVSQIEQTPRGRRAQDQHIAGKTGATTGGRRLRENCAPACNKGAHHAIIGNNRNRASTLSQVRKTNATYSDCTGPAWIRHPHL